MIKRTVEVSTPGTYIHMRYRNLVFSREGEEVGRVPCEDLGVLVLDEPRLDCTQSALVAAAEAGAAVILCGRDHVPAGLLLPLAANQLHAQRLRLQLDVKRPLGKRLWRQIVRAKLRGQAALIPHDHPARGRILAIAEEVRSGDPENKEAQGARLYWPALFNDPKFRRGRKGPAPNTFLNYGYMVVRAAIARAVCIAGLHPAIGLHHHHRENNFCLADDLMEPYRPYVDGRVRFLWRSGAKEMDKEAKKTLLEVLTDTVAVNGEQGPLMVAVSKTVASLVKCYAGEAEQLDLPEP